MKIPPYLFFLYPQTPNIIQLMFEWFHVHAGGSAEFLLERFAEMADITVSNQAGDLLYLIIPIGKQFPCFLHSAL